MKYHLTCTILLFVSFFVGDTATGQQTLTTISDWKRDAHRPQFHFTPKAHWMNDPNGLCWFDSTYHLFYQYYPDDIVWGPMHWGHATSKDMVHWTHQPIALYPDSLGYIFSGSIVVDKTNTSGLASAEQPAMVAFFTHHNPVKEKLGRNDFQYQSMAWSDDGGRTFTKYENNPVIGNPGIRDFRDPKVIWHAPSGKWIMVLAAYDQVRFYISSNLKEWDYASSFGILGDTRLWECPDLFPIRVQGTDEEKWILLTSIQNGAPNGGTATSYFVGDFDGNRFIADPRQQKWLDYGTDNYAMVTWSNVPDGRTLALGWMSNWQYAQRVPTERWRSAMTLPRELTLHRDQGDFWVNSLPAVECARLQHTNEPLREGAVHQNALLYDSLTLVRLAITSETRVEGDVTVRFTNGRGEELLVGFDAQRSAFFIDRTRAGDADFYPAFASRHYSLPISLLDGLQLEVFLDHSSVEVFGQKGRIAMTDIFFPSTPFNKAEILQKEAPSSPVRFAVWPLNSIWK